MSISVTGGDAMYKPDIVISDENSQPIVIVEVIAVKPDNKKTGFYYYKNVQEYMQRTRAKFLIIVTRKIMEIWEKDKDEPIEQLQTKRALKHYSGFPTLDTVTHGYIKALVDAWLNDLISHWKMERPTYEAKLKKIGLLSLIKNGSVREEVSV